MAGNSALLENNGIVVNTTGSVDADGNYISQFLGQMGAVRTVPNTGETHVSRVYNIDSTGEKTVLTENTTNIPTTKFDKSQVSFKASMLVSETRISELYGDAEAEVSMVGEASVLTNLEADQEIYAVAVKNASLVPSNGSATLESDIVYASPEELVAKIQNMAKTLTGRLGGQKQVDVWISTKYEATDLLGGLIPNSGIYWKDHLVSPSFMGGLHFITPEVMNSKEYGEIDEDTILFTNNEVLETLTTGYPETKMLNLPATGSVTSYKSYEHTRGRFFVYTKYDRGMIVSKLVPSSVLNAQKNGTNAQKYNLEKELGAVASRLGELEVALATVNSELNVIKTLPNGDEKNSKNNVAVAKKDKLEATIKEIKELKKDLAVAIKANKTDEIETILKDIAKKLEKEA